MRSVAVIPAFNNGRTIAAAVGALLDDTRISEVIVVDDASTDDTSAAASGAGARVVRHPSNGGKHEALETGFREAGAADVLLMVDGDTGRSAGSAVDLVDPVIRGEADMVVGTLPSAGRKGGFGLVRDFAAWMIKRTSGYEATAPMSGQRALRREVWETCRPLTIGFAVDARLTADAVRLGFTVIERPVDMTHDHRGRSLRGFAHRARQGWHIARAFFPLLVRPRTRR